MICIVKSGLCRQSNRLNQLFTASYFFRPTSPKRDLDHQWLPDSAGVSPGPGLSGLCPRLGDDSEDVGDAAQHRHLHPHLGLRAPPAGRGEAGVRGLQQQHFSARQVKPLPQSSRWD